MALSRTRHAAVFNGSATTSIATASFTPPDNSVLVAVVAFTDSRTSGWTTQPTISGGGLTWTNQLWHTGSSQYGGSVGVWTAVVTTGASMTVTASYGASSFANGANIAVYSYTGADTSDPIGLTAANGAEASRDGSPYSLSLGGTVSSGSQVLAFCLLDELQTTSMAAPGTGYTEDTETFLGAGVGLQLQYATGSVSSAEWSSIQCNYMWRAAAVEIKAASALAYVVRHSQDFTTDNAASYVTTSFTPSNNTLLVAVVQGQYNSVQNEPSPPTVSGGSLSWTRRAWQGYANWGSEILGGIWTAPVSTGASMTFTFPCPANMFNASITIYEFTGFDTDNPVGATLAVRSGSRSGSYSGSMSATPAADSIVVAAAGIDDGTLALGSGWTQDDRADDLDGYADYLFQSKLGPSTVDFATLASSYSTNVVALEIRKAGASAPKLKNLMLLGVG